LLYARTRKQQVSFVEIAVQWDFGHTPSASSFFAVAHVTWAALLAFT